MYLESFHLPVAQEERLLAKQAAQNGGQFGYVDNPYPCHLFSVKGLTDIAFRPITIFYGGNGSGKSTLLNLIAQKLMLNRIAPFNSGEMFALYTERCTFTLGTDEEGFPHRIPDGSRIITSDDVFDYMLTVRTNNSEVAEYRDNARQEWANLKFGESIQIHGPEDYEALRMQVMARSKSLSRRQFIRKTAGEETALKSNGETALAYFQQKIKTNTLYCLDEPENSLSPKRQLELTAFLREMARYCGVQLIIATHSPFLLALPNAKIYDLDTSPVESKNWWELENTKLYYQFFREHKALFE